MSHYKSFFTFMKQPDDLNNIVNNDEGQSIVEFILLLAVLLSISIIVLKGFNASIATRWLDLVTIITAPNDGNINFF